MEELTLTGGTLVASEDTPASLGGGNMNKASTPKKEECCEHNHHSHSHSHGKKDCCDHDHGHTHAHVGHIEMSNMPKTLEALLTATREDIGRAMSTLFRFGRFEAVEPILKHLLEQKGKEEMAQLLKDFDDGGHSLLHWASKRIDDSRFIQKVVDLVVELQITEVFNVASKDNVGMRPLHWS